MTDEELSSEFGDHGWKQLPDEVYRRYRFTPAKVEVEEHHVGVYVSKKKTAFVRSKHPGYLLRNSPVSPFLEAAILNAKYVSAVLLYCQEKEFKRYGLNITRKNMADWTIRYAKRYLAVLYDHLHEKLYDCHVIQANETSMLVNRDGRPAGSKSYMWVYCSGRMCKDTPIVLYDYQRTRNAIHPREYLKGFKGVCVADEY